MLKSLNINGLKLIVELAKSSLDLLEAKAVDDAAFGDNQGITLEELAKIRAGGALILMSLKSNRRLIGQSQILFSPIAELPCHFTKPTGYCYGTGLLPAFQGRGTQFSQAPNSELRTPNSDLRMA